MASDSIRGDSAFDHRAEYGDGMRDLKFRGREREVGLYHDRASARSSQHRAFSRDETNVGVRRLPPQGGGHACAS
eukprot:scaffold251780_cov31-Tisochrysis_lutea.AAC.2